MFTSPEENGLPEENQPNQYDKLWKENIENALPGLMKNVLHIQAVHSEELPDDLQYTKERKPDALKKITDAEGNIFVLHIEFQTGSDPRMVFRMAEYLIMLARQYKLPVRQYVIYIGEGKSTMLQELRLGINYFCYELISLSSIDYHLFLNSDTLEERMLAILGDFGNDSPETVMNIITAAILQNSQGELELEQRKNQLRLFSKLRSLVFKKITNMQIDSDVFKDENDFLYIMGEKKGEDKKNHEFVKNLLLADKFTISEIATYAGVTEDFVVKVKNALN